jgi:phytoene dehydrogenase-like protein
MEKSIIIVGAGMAGLSTGCFAQMNGYKTTIFEMHNIPGGLCTAWKRKGYKFDISMHMLGPGWIYNNSFKFKQSVSDWE